MSNSYNVHIVPHTHWDREWYLTKQEFSLLLTRVIGRLIDILDTEPDYPAFTLDGQTITLEDYLELQPETGVRLRELIAEGRILVGPWYILPDEVLVSGEAHIRNFLEGMRVAREFGGGMMVGYLPDSFGHPSQMPQILLGLGLREIVFWRGLGPEIDTTEFQWTGFDGSTILGINMPLGYGAGAALPADDEELLERIEKRCGELTRLTRTRSLLLMNGVDHMAPERDLPARVERANKRTRLNLRLSTLPQYLDDIREQLQPADLPGTAGELRSGYRAYLLGGTLSTRIYLKQLNCRVESLLERELEPLLSAAELLGVAPYPRGVMRHLWRNALKNLPHDSICGCSIDEVHDQMVSRYREILLTGEALKQEHLVLIGNAAEHSNGEQIIVFNPHPFAVSEWVEFEIDLGLTLARRVDHSEARLVEYSEEPHQPPDRIVLEAEGALRVEGQIVTATRVETMRLSVDDQPVMYRANRLRIRFAALDLLPLGYRLYRVIATSGEDTSSVGSVGKLPSGEVAAGSDRSVPSREVWIDNEHLRVGPEAAGTIRVLDKRTGIEYPGLLALEDGGDAGDEYTYCPPAADRRVAVNTPEDGAADAAGTEVGSIQAVRQDEHSFQISGTMMLPRALTPDRSRREDTAVACPFSITVRLHPTEARVDLQIEFTNNAADHILKIVLPTGLQTDRSMAGGTFCVDERRVSPDSTEDYSDWMERPSSVYPQKGFVTVSDGTRAITVACRGLPEYEFRPAGPSAPEEGASIAVTLLRCVGYLSRPDLACRPGNAGWPLETPGAQCGGSHRFDLALLIHSESHSRLIPAMSRVFLTPPVAAQLRPAVDPEMDRSTQALPSESSILSIDNPGIVLSAIKQRESGDGLIIRVVNPQAYPAEGVLSWNPEIAGRIVRVVRCNLAEVEEAAYPIEDGNVRLRLRGGEILTLAVVLRLPDNP